MTQGPFSHRTEPIYFLAQAFTKVTYHGFFKCEGKCYPNTQLELYWKMLLYIKIFYLITFYFGYILFFILFYFIFITTDVIVVIFYYN